MIKRIRVIGIGMGDPDHVTGEAARALATVDVFLVADKGRPRPTSSQPARPSATPSSLRTTRTASWRSPTRHGARTPGATQRHTARVREWHEPHGWPPMRRSSTGSAERETTVGFLVSGDAAPATTRRSGSWTRSWNGGQCAAGCRP